MDVFSPFYVILGEYVMFFQFEKSTISLHNFLQTVRLNQQLATMYS